MDLNFKNGEEWYENKKGSSFFRRKKIFIYIIRQMNFMIVILDFGRRQLFKGDKLYGLVLCI